MKTWAWFASVDNIAISKNGLSSLRETLIIWLVDFDHLFNRQMDTEFTKYKSSHMCNVIIYNFYLSSLNFLVESSIFQI